jgi:hypothetical protein
MSKGQILYTPFLSHLRIATDAHTKMLRYVEEHGHERLQEHSFELTAQGQATVVVVFTITALECYIQLYAARELGERYATRHIEKLDLVSKWIVVPKLVTGRDIRSDHKGIEMLAKLVKARNDVVHLKGKNLKPDEWEVQKSTIIRNDRRILEAGVSAFRCVGELGRELYRLHPQEYGAGLLAGFLSTPDYKIKSSNQ